MAAHPPLSLLLEEEGAKEEEETLRSLLLQATQKNQGPPTAPARTITPQPGLCVKIQDERSEILTREAGGSKVFINVCHSPEVPPPPPLNDPPLSGGLQQLLQDSPSSPPPLSLHSPHGNGDFRIPMSLGEPHAELDKGGQPCTAHDVVINSSFFRILQKDPLYLEFFLTVVMEGLSEKFGVELDLTDWRVLKNRRFLGSLSTQRIRGRGGQPKIQEIEEPAEKPALTTASPSVALQFVVVAKPSAQDPQVLETRVLLPNISRAASLWLGLSEEQLVLLGREKEGEKGRPPPLLELRLPFPTDPTQCHARFHRPSRVLTVTSPCRRGPPLRPSQFPSVPP